MLVKGKLATEMKKFISKVNEMKQEDKDKAIDTYCNKLEEVVYGAIKDITITIPPSTIQVQGTSAAQVNLNPIVLKNVIS